MPHEDRRELRGTRVLTAWLNHYDTGENNTLAMWIPVGPAGGYVRHLTIDWNDSFGFLWPEGLDPIQRRLGFSYYLDFDLVLRDFATLGIPERPWDRAAVGVTGPSWATSRMRTLTRNDGSLDTRTRPAGWIPPSDP